MALLVGLSRLVSKAVAETGSAGGGGGRLAKVVGHLELRRRGLVRRTNGGTDVRQGSEFFLARFRNTQPGAIGTRLAGAETLNSNPAGSCCPFGTALAFPIRN